MACFRRNPTPWEQGPLIASTGSTYHKTDTETLTEIEQRILFKATLTPEVLENIWIFGTFFQKTKWRLDQAGNPIF